MRMIDADALKGPIELQRVFYVRIGATERAEAYANCLWEIAEAPTVGAWISVKDRLPEEHESIFHKFLGTPKWSSAMWQQESDKVLVYVSFPDGTGVVTTGCLHNSDWMTTVSKALPQTVTHWMPLPEPPKEVSGDADKGV